VKSKKENVQGHSTCQACTKKTKDTEIFACSWAVKHPDSAENENEIESIVGRKKKYRASAF